MNRRIQADMTLTLCALVWGATFVTVKAALQHASVFVFMGLRFGFAAALMAIVFAATGRRLTRAEIWPGVRIGLFMFGGYLLQTTGLLRTTPSKAAFITGFSVVLVPLLEAVFSRRRIHLWVWGGALGAFAGLYYLSVPPAGIRELNTGDLLVLGCAAMFAGHILLVGHYSRRRSVSALSFVQVATTAVFTLTALPAAALAGWEAPRAEWDAHLILAVFITAVLATAGAFSVQVWAQQYTTAAHAAILLTLEPVFAALTSYIVMHERLSKRGLLGGALILAGILLAELRGPTEAAPEWPQPATDI